MRAQNYGGKRCGSSAVQKGDGKGKGSAPVSGGPGPAGQKECEQGMRGLRG